MNTLCFDFGNTRLKIAFFQNAKLAEVIVIENDEIATIGSVLEKFDAQKTILSSVIDHNPEIETLLAKKTKFHKLIGWRYVQLQFIFFPSSITW